MAAFGLTLAAPLNEPEAASYDSQTTDRPTGRINSTPEARELGRHA